MGAVQYVYKDTVPSEKTRYVQSIPYLRGLIQSECESNLCPSVNTRTQVQLTTPTVYDLCHIKARDIEKNLKIRF